MDTHKDPMAYPHPAPEPSAPDASLPTPKYPVPLLEDLIKFYELEIAALRAEVQRLRAQVERTRARTNTP
jgi:uncharacterized small protein (DUF1192 family)